MLMPLKTLLFITMEMDLINLVAHGVKLMVPMPLPTLLLITTHLDMVPLAVALIPTQVVMVLNLFLNTEEILTTTDRVIEFMEYLSNIIYMSSFFVLSDKFIFELLSGFF